MARKKLPESRPKENPQETANAAKDPAIMTRRAPYCESFEDALLMFSALPETEGSGHTFWHHYTKTKMKDDLRFLTTYEFQKTGFRGFTLHLDGFTLKPGTSSEEAILRSIVKQRPTWSVDLDGYFTPKRARAKLLCPTCRKHAPIFLRAAEGSAMCFHCGYDPDKHSNFNMHWNWGTGQYSHENKKESERKRPGDASHPAFGKILRFPVPDSTELSNFIEEIDQALDDILQDCVARPSGRLLRISPPDTPLDPAGIVSGVFLWDQFSNDSAGHDGDSVELLYKLSPIPMPDWDADERRNRSTERWFMMSLESPGGTIVAKTTLRQGGFGYRPQCFCFNCHEQASETYIDELTGKGCCQACLPQLWQNKCGRTILWARERLARRIVCDHYSVKGITMSFFERHRTLLTSYPRAYKVFNQRVQIKPLGYFVADPEHMPLIESANIEVHEQ